MQTLETPSDIFRGSETEMFGRELGINTILIEKRSTFVVDALIGDGIWNWTQAAESKLLFSHTYVWPECCFKEISSTILKPYLLCMQES